MAQQNNKRITYAVVEIPKGDGIPHMTQVAVPWIYLFKKKGDSDQNMFVKFMKLPLSPDDEKLLAEFLAKPDLHAPESWPLFKCTIIATFGSHKEATDYLLNRLPPKQLQMINKGKATTKISNTRGNTTKNIDKVTANNADDDLDKFLLDLPSIPSLTQAGVSPHMEIFPENGLASTTEEDARIDRALEDARIDGALDDGIKEDNAVAEITKECETASVMMPTENATVDISSLFVSKNDLQGLLLAVQTHVDHKFAEMQVHFDTKISGLESKIDSLGVKMTNIQADIDEMKTWTVDNRKFGNDENIMPLATLIQKHSLILPLAELQHFDDFNAKLIVDSDLYKDLKNHFVCTINTANKDFVEELTKLIKKILSREIVIAHTAQRLSNHKTRIFKGTNFYICVKDSLMHAYSGKKVIEDTMLCQAIGSIINNAPDWDGFRNKRMKLTKK